MNRTALKGFIAIYRWTVESEWEAEFRSRWHDLTLEGRRHGALGSCLTKNANGDFVAIALWPAAETRKQAFAEIDIGAPWRGAVRLSEEALTIEDDLWTDSPFAKLK